MSQTPKKLPAHLQFFIELLPLNEPVHQRTLFEAYGKPTYARRIRKIVSEYGWDIERRRGHNGANDDYYIRRSDGPVRPQRIRREVPKSRRNEVYKRDGWLCQLCQSNVGPSQNTLQPQCDHKVPAERGGNSQNTNLQTVCVVCNLKKRQTCASCTLESCSGCPFAQPEQLKSVLLVDFDSNVFDALVRLANEHDVSPSEAAASLLRDLLA